MRLFQNFLDYTKGSPFICFDTLQHNGCQKIPKVHPFYSFRHCDTVQKSHLKKVSFSKFPNGPPSVFFIFCNQLVQITSSQSNQLTNPKESPFSILSLGYSADVGRSRLVFRKTSANRVLVIQCTMFIAHIDAQCNQ